MRELSRVWKRLNRVFGRPYRKWMKARGWVRRDWISYGGLVQAKNRERRRARAAEALLREASALLRNDPNMRGWRDRAIAQLESVGRYDANRAKPSDLVELGGTE